MKNQPTYIKGILLVFLGAICFSTKAIFIKLAFRYNVDAITMLLFRMLFSIPFYLVILIYTKSKKQQSTIEKSEFINLISLGLFGYYLSSFFDMYGLQFITANLERLIIFIYPTIVLFFGRLFYKRKIHRIQIFAVLISYFGIALAFYSDSKIIQSNDYIKGAIFIFMSAITYAFYLVKADTSISKIGSIQFTCYSMLISSVAVLIHYIIVHGFNIFHFQKIIYVYGLLIAIFATVLPTFLINYGIKLIGSSNTAIIGSVGPISTITLSAIVLKEQISYMHIIGTFLVLFGVLVISIFGNKAKVVVE